MTASDDVVYFKDVKCKNRKYRCFYAKLPRTFNLDTKYFEFLQIRLHNQTAKAKSCLVPQFSDSETTSLIETVCLS